MKCLVFAVLALVLMPSLAREVEVQPRTPSMVELIAAPQKFKDQWVTVKGFLQFVGRRRNLANLGLSQADVENSLDNGVGVWANEQMLKDREKLNYMYVILTGKVRVVPAAGGGFVVQIEEIKACHVWSDPKHPVGLTLEPRPGDRD